MGLIAVFCAVTVFFLKKKGISVGGVLKTSVFLILGVLILNLPRKRSTFHTLKGPLN